MAAGESQLLFRGRHISVMAQGSWEYVQRNTGRPAIGVVAITDDRKVLLVEQYRVPLAASLMELPAGLSGDIVGAEQEPLLEAAQRELSEETGYEASRWTELVSVSSSPGLTDEQITFFLAEGLRRVGPGGGDAHEAITVHEVPWDNVFEWLQQHGALQDMKLLAALFAAHQVLARRIKQ